MLFFKTIPPVDPVVVVKKICQDAMDEPMRKRTRFVKRLSPVTLMARASEEGLKKVASDVLAPHFHQEPIQPQKVSHSEARPSSFAAASSFWHPMAPIDNAITAFA